MWSPWLWVKVIVSSFPSVRSATSCLSDSTALSAHLMLFERSISKAFFLPTMRYMSEQLLKCTILPSSLNISPAGKSEL